MTGKLRRNMKPGGAMGKQVRPDDVARSPSGRVPKWVLDEARGIPPTELVPFRAATAPLIHNTGGLSSSGGSRLRMWLLVVVITVSVLSWIQFAGTGGLKAFMQGPSPVNPRGGYGPPPGAEEAGRRLDQPTVFARTPSDRYRFLRHQQDKTTPVTWSPCRPIHYVIRPDHSPAMGPALLEQAFTDVAAATGLVFVNDGGTSEAPAVDRSPYQKETYGNRWAPVYIAWATADEVPDFGVDIAGEAGPSPVTNERGQGAYVSGTVLFDAAYFNQLLVRPGSEPFAKAIVLHELGHLMGLAHVNDHQQVMAPRGGEGRPTSYQGGDLTGLNLLGNGPCQPNL